MLRESSSCNTRFAFISYCISYLGRLNNFNSYSESDPVHEEIYSTTECNHLLGC